MTDHEGLRKPFSKSQIMTLPRTAKRPALDYVSHAAVTQRLIEVAPDWSVRVLDQFAHENEFWVRVELSIDGVTRQEFGGGGDPKKAMSDALKRAAMRFGVALDLWAKEELVIEGSASQAEGPAEVETSEGVGEVIQLGKPGPEPTPSDDPDRATKEELWTAYLAWTEDAGVRPLGTFIKANERSVKANDLPYNVEVEEIQKAIKYVSEKALAGEKP